MVQVVLFSVLGDAVRKRVSSKSKRQAPSTAVGRTLVISGFGEGVTKKQIFKRCRKLGDLEETVFPVEGEFVML